MNNDTNTPLTPEEQAEKFARANDWPTDRSIYAELKNGFSAGYYSGYEQGKKEGIIASTFLLYEKVEKSITPTWDEIKNGALVMYTNGKLETIHGHIRFFDKRPDGTDEWTAGSSDDMTDYVDYWLRKIKPSPPKE